MTDRKTIRIGTRGSALARWQSDYVAELLKTAYPDLDIEIVVISTRGDRVLDTPLPLIGGKGLFTAELEAALHSGEIDLAVHSLKDLPTEDPEGLTIGAVPERAPVNDVLVSRDGKRLADLQHNAVIGTSSRRRAAQLKKLRPDLEIIDIRGNVPTRIDKTRAADGPYDATILASAGLTRLSLLDESMEILPTDTMLPAPGQGALGVQCRDDADSLALLAPLNHHETRLAVEAERGFLAGLGGGCSIPVAAHGQIMGDLLSVSGRVSSVDGSKQVDLHLDVKAENLSYHEARKQGEQLAGAAMSQGAKEILEQVS